MKRIICFGPGPKFKGGIANYNLSLARFLSQQPGIEVQLISWSQQYPFFIPREFIDKKSKKELSQNDLQVQYITDFNNPFSWKKTADLIIRSEPDMLIVQWAIAIQGLPVGRIIKRVKKKIKTEIVFVLHNIIQKESSVLDSYFTKMAIRYADTFVTHSQQTIEQLRQFTPGINYYISEKGERSQTGEKTVIKLYHPVYTLYSPDENFDLAAFKNTLHLKKYVFLFFGFIRKYKGLHDCIAAFAKLAEKRDDVSLLICGESFWNTIDSKKAASKFRRFIFRLLKSVVLKKKDKDENYRPLELIAQLGIENNTVVVNEFIPNENVHKYFQASDAVLLFYENPMPSGVESLSYNFKKPILATDAGYFQEEIKDGINGYLAKPGDINSMADAMLKIITNPIRESAIEQVAKNMSWENYVRTLLNIS